MPTPGQDIVETSSARLILSLGMAGLLSGLFIVSIYELTRPTITANKARAVREAVLKVLPSATQLQRLRYEDETLKPVAVQDEGGESVYAGYDRTGNFIGYAIPGEGPGYQDTIRLLYGYRPDRRMVVGMEVLDSRETPGLGDKIYKDAAFQGNFHALAVDPEIIMVKKGEKHRPNQVDAITGATISSQAVVRIINATHQHWDHRLPSSGIEPLLSPSSSSS